LNKLEAEFKANANHRDGTVPWRNDPWGRPFKANSEKPWRPIAAFGCDRETNGGPVCPHWCGQDKCGVVLGESEPAPGVTVLDHQSFSPSRTDGGNR